MNRNVQTIHSNIYIYKYVYNAIVLIIDSPVPFIAVQSG